MSSTKQANVVRASMAPLKQKPGKAAEVRINRLRRYEEEFVLVPKDAWERLVRGDVEMPEFPPINDRGNRDAIQYARVSIARTIIRDRVAAGLSQAELAKLAGVTRQVLNRIERAKVTPDETTVGKLDNAIRKAARRQAAARSA